MIILSFATTHLQKSVFYNMLIIAERFELRLGRQISFKKLKITFLMKITLFIILYIGFLTIFNTMKIYDAYGIDKYLAWVGFTIIRITFTGKLFTLYADLIHHFLMNIESCINEAIVDKNLAKITSAFVNYHDFYERISAMKSIYGLIWDTTNLINRCMGKILLFLLTLGVVSVTAAGYKIFLIIVSNDPALDLIGKLSMNGGDFLCLKTDIFTAPFIYNFVILMGFFSMIYSAQVCSSDVSTNPFFDSNMKSFYERIAGGKHYIFIEQIRIRRQVKSDSSCS
jgi:hypothetical protein